MSFGNRLKRGWTQEVLANGLGLSRNTIAGYESPSKSREPGLEMLTRISAVFEVTVDYLLGLTTAEQAPRKPDPKMRVPVYKDSLTYLPPLHEESAIGHLDLPAGIGADFAVEVTGRDLLWTGICPGDLVLCLGLAAADHGQLAAVATPSGGTGRQELIMRYMVLDKGGWTLRAANPDQADRPLRPGDQVAGVAVAIVKNPPALDTYFELLSLRDVRVRGWNEVILEATRLGVKKEQVKSLIGFFAGLLDNHPKKD